MTQRVVARPWTVLASKVSFADRWIKIRTDDVRNGRGEIIPDYHVLEYPDWINVLPVLDDGRLLLVCEYRHGVRQVVLGLIAGSVAVGDSEAEAAARRELLEETGYGAKALIRLLTCFPNAASHSNQVSTFVAHGLHQVAEPGFEVGEEVELVVVEADELFTGIREGRIIMQAMHLAGLYAAAHAGLISRQPPSS